MKYTSFVLALLVAITITGVAFAGEFVPGGTVAVQVQSQQQTIMQVSAPTPNLAVPPTTGSCARIPVQRVAQLRCLTPAEEFAIRDYIAQKRCNLSEENATALEAALRFLVAIDQSHVPLTRTPAQYLADYQTFTQLYGRTDWYVNVPMPAQTPPLCLPPLQPCQAAQVAPVCVQPVKLDLLPVCKEVCASACAPTCYPAGAVAFGRPGERRERTIGGFAITPGFQSAEQEETCPEDGKPPCPSGTDEAGEGVNPGSGSHGPGYGHPGGYRSGGATLPPTPPGYGNSTPPWAGPRPPFTPGRGGGSYGGGHLVRPAR